MIPTLYEPFRHWSEGGSIYILMMLITMNVYTHISFDDAEEELKRIEEFRKAQAEIEKKNDAKAVLQKMFKVMQQCYAAETLQLYWGVFSMEK